MRLIDADVLIEILTTAIRNMKGMAKFLNAEDDPEIKMEIKAYTDILNGVKEQPTIEPDLKWIPCKERLPEEMTRVLTTIKMPSREPQVRSGIYSDGFFMNDNGDIWRSADKEVKAWMPLPEPYREEK